MLKDDDETYKKLVKAVEKVFGNKLSQSKHDKLINSLFSILQKKKDILINQYLNDNFPETSNPESDFKYHQQSPQSNAFVPPYFQQSPQNSFAYFPYYFYPSNFYDPSIIVNPENQNQKQSNEKIVNKTNKSDKINEKKQEFDENIFIDQNTYYFNQPFRDSKTESKQEQESRATKPSIHEYRNTNDKNSYFYTPQEPQINEKSRSHYEGAWREPEQSVFRIEEPHGKPRREEQSEKVEYGIQNTAYKDEQSKEVQKARGHDVQSEVQTDLHKDGRFSWWQSGKPSCEDQGGKSLEEQNGFLEEKAQCETCKDEQVKLNQYEDTQRNQERNEARACGAQAKLQSRSSRVISAPEDRSMRAGEREAEDRLSSLFSTLKGRITSLKVRLNYPLNDITLSLHFINDIMVSIALDDCVTCYSRSNAILKEILTAKTEKSPSFLPNLNGATSLHLSDNEDEELARLKSDVRALEKQISIIDESIQREKANSFAGSTTEAAAAAAAKQHEKHCLFVPDKTDAKTSNQREKLCSFDGEQKASAGLVKVHEPTKSKTDSQKTVSAVSCSPRSFRNRIRFLTKKAESGDVASCVSLAVCFMTGEGVELNQKRAFELYSDAAEQGDRDAIYAVAACFSYGKGVDVDKAKALHFYVKAAELGHCKAQFAAGHFYEYGVGCVEADHEAASEWYKKAASQGHKGAIKAIEESTFSYQK